MKKDEIRARLIHTIIQCNVKGIPIIKAYEELSKKYPQWVTHETFVDAFAKSIDREYMVGKAEEEVKEIKDPMKKKKAEEMLKEIQKAENRTFH